MFLLPAIVFFPLLFFVPIFSQLVTSFEDTSNGSASVSASNYQRALSDPTVLHSFVITLLYAALSLAIGIVVGLLLAVVLNQALPGRAVFRAILLVPYLTSVSIVGLLWRNLLDPQVGILNRVLLAAGLPEQHWLSSHPLGVIVGITVWSTSGYTMLLFLAGLQSIPNEYHEAAKMDGASPTRRFISITLPLLAPTTLFVSIIGVIGSLQQFALPYIVTNGGPADATNLYAFKVFDVAFSDSDFGYASALSVLLLIVILILSLAQLRLGRKGLES